MNEKEMITKAIEYIDNKWNGIIPNYDAVDEWLDEFLQHHHRNYKPVYFYKVDRKEQDIVKEQVRIKLEDFLDFMDLHLDNVYQDIKIEQYIKEKF